MASRNKHIRLDAAAAATVSSSNMDDTASDVITLVCPVDDESTTNNGQGTTAELTAARHFIERSPVWKIALQHGSLLNEARNRRIYITDFTIETVRAMLTALDRPAHLSNMALDQVQAVFICAEKYDLSAAKQSAEDRLIAAVDELSADELTESAADLIMLYRFARDYSSPRIGNKCVVRLQSLLDKAIPKENVKVRRPPIPSFDTTAFFALIRDLTEAGGADKVLQRVPTEIARLVEWLHRLIASKLRARLLIYEKAESPEETYTRHVLPILAGFAKATAEEMPIARLAIRAVLREAVSSRRLAFLDWLPSASLSPWVHDEATLQKRIFSSFIRLQVEYRDVVDESGTTVAVGNGKDEDEKVPMSYITFVETMSRKCEAFSEKWREKWRGIAVTHHEMRTLACDRSAGAVVNFLNKTEFVRPKYKLASVNDFIIRGVVVGVECKTEAVTGEDAAQPTGVRLLLTEFSTELTVDDGPWGNKGGYSAVPICDLLELAGYDMNDSSNYPALLKLVIMDFRAIMKAVENGQHVPWLLGGFGLDLNNEYYHQRCTMEEFVKAAAAAAASTKDGMRRY